MLENIKLPEELKSLSIDDLKILCSDIRKEIIEKVSINGGHLSSNLGVVELSVMLHYVFNLPNDKLLFDVSHQCYTHKILSGRNLVNLRQINGVSGFYSKEESEYDCYLSGHSSTSVSTALGMATARDLKDEHNEVIAVIGDASLANGVAMEGVNNLLSSHSKVILIVNDNGMSISKTVGGLSKVLNNIKSSKAYQKGKRKYRNTFNKGKIRKLFYDLSCKIKGSFERLFLKENILENLGIDYLGVVDGHNLEKLNDALNIAKHNDKSIIVHVKTIKGYGCNPILNDVDGKWHGVGKFDLSTFDVGEAKVSFDDIVCDYLCDNVFDKNLCVITPAMKSGSKLEPFFNKYSDRSFDVGISEEHAFVFANGLALNGVVPYISVYSTFMQRSYDFINQDLVRNNSKCVIGVERVGLVGEDGESHHGIFDVPFLNTIPEITVYSPTYYNEMRNAFVKALYHDKGVVAVRMFKGSEPEIPDSFVSSFEDYDVYGDINADVAIVTYGRLFANAATAVNKLTSNGKSVKVIKLNKIKPIPSGAVDEVKNCSHIFFLEEGEKSGGCGEIFNMLLTEASFKGKFNLRAVNDEFVCHATTEILLEKFGFDSDSITDLVQEVLTQ